MEELICLFRYVKNQAAIKGKESMETGARIWDTCVFDHAVLCASVCIGNTEAWESVATIGDATWTNALPQDIQADAEESAFTESEETVQSVSPSAYYQAPDTSNAFVAYAMTIPKGSGKTAIICVRFM